MAGRPNLLTTTTTNTARTYYYSTSSDRIKPRPTPPRPLREFTELKLNDKLPRYKWPNYNFQPQKTKTTQILMTEL